ncbi:hypothetical protein I8751_15670 [Nostocaceae cyanobacterium CENA357]|uniref:Uncharacterized protein n=1 Tax=Atlanticothrix silvestris CENA357 TaxID=1725252 RepID=A0A8J7L3I1_9CYAN|nr:hypothetical protein [Atlanticothrix silvestris]MBH8553781.1 hypothetical protein [Atlanticothrix silvestris CENA357]
MAAFLYPIYTLATFGLAIWGIILFQQSHRVSTILLIVVVAGMIYDNLIVSVGRLINEGALLKLLNRLRFLFHNLCVPLLVVVAVNLANIAGVPWANNSILYKSCWAIAIALITLGLLTDFRQLELIPTAFAGTLRYKPKSCGVPILTILTALLVAVVGFCIWHQTQWLWMFVGTLIMLVGNALPKSIFGPLLGSVVDCIFILTLLATDLMMSEFMH